MMTATTGQLAELDQLGKALLDAAFEEALLQPRVEEAQRKIKSGEAVDPASVPELIDLIKESIEVGTKRLSTLNSYVAARRMVESA